MSDPSLAGDIADVIRENPERYGLVDKLRPATIAQDTTDVKTALATIDGDDIASEVMNLTGKALTAGRRVMVSLVEPHGAYIAGMVDEEPAPCGCDDPPTIAGVRSGGTALTALLAGLDASGAIVDTTTPGPAASVMAGARITNTGPYSFVLGPIGIVVLPTAEFDNDAMTVTANRITINQAGLYTITARAFLVGPAALGSANIYVKRSPGIQYIGSAGVGAGAASALVNIATQWPLAAGDYLELYADTGGSGWSLVSNDAANATWPYLSVARHGPFS